MSVRHIHARSGEYSAVHRGGHHTSSGGGDEGLFYAVGIVAAVLIIYFFWKIILACLLIAAALGLVWTYRVQIWHGICWLSPNVWNGV